MTSYQRSQVQRMDGRLINVVHHRGHLLVCSKGCCCGITPRGFAPVPEDLYHTEWEGRKLRNKVHLTQSGCLGPCMMANTVLLVFDGHPIWFQSVNRREQILAIYDYIEAMLAADGYLPPPPQLADYVFDFYTWSHQQGIGAADEAPADFPPVHAANLLNIKNDAHMVDLLNDKGSDARVIVARILGRTSSIPGFQHLLDHVRQTDQQLIVISGTDSFEPELAAVSTVPLATLHDVMEYFSAHGSGNMAQMLRYLADHLLMYGFGYDAPKPQPEHGLYHPALPPLPTIEQWRACSNPALPTVGVVFYRSHWLSGNIDFVDALVKALEARGMNALPIFTATLRHFHRRENVAGRTVEQFPETFDVALDADGQPMVDVLISTLSYAMGGVNPDGATLSTWSAEAFDALDVPVLQAITAGTTRWQWEGAARGLTPLDTAANVALPEFDGRIITVPISFKEQVNTLTPTHRGLASLVWPARAAERRLRPGGRARLQPPLVDYGQPKDAGPLSLPSPSGRGEKANAFTPNSGTFQMEPQGNFADACVTDYQPDVDYFPVKTELTDAKDFNVQYLRNYKVVTVTDAFPGAAPFTYVLTQCGTPAPDKAGFPADAQFLDVPVKSVIALSDTELPHLSELGQLDKLIGLDSFKYVNSPDALKLIDAGKLTEIGSGAQVNVEKALDLAPDVVLTFGYNPTTDAHPLLIKAGIVTALNAEWREATPLGRAQWIKYTALFFNAEARAADVYQGIADAYHEAQQLAATVTDDQKPTVLWNVLSPTVDSWTIPGSHTYAAKFILDAGGKIALGDQAPNQSVKLSFETVYDQALDADVWVTNAFGVNSLTDLLVADARYGDFAAVKNGHVWNNTLDVNANGGNNYWELGVTNPNLILRDLVAILHPDLLPDHPFVFYRPLTDEGTPAP